MTARQMVWHGRTYISVSEAASCYSIEVRQIEQWVEEDLLAPPAAIEGERAVPVDELDRIALLVRCTRVLGLDAAAIHLIVR